MKAAFGVSWNDAKPRRMSALLALAVAGLLTLAMTMAGHGTTDSHASSQASLFGGSIVRTTPSTGLGGGLGEILPAGATWS